MTNKLDKWQKKSIFKTVDGREVMYTFSLLSAKKALRIFHTTISSIITLIASTARSGGDISGIIQALDFDTLESLAGPLLYGAIVRPNGPSSNDDMFTLTDPLEHEYFLDNQTELYLAIWEALKANYPKQYSAIMEKLKDSPLLKRLQKGQITA